MTYFETNSKMNLLLYLSTLILMLRIGVIAKPSRRMNLEIFSSSCSTLTALYRTFNCTLLQASPGVYYFSDVLSFTKDINDSFDVRVRVDGQYLSRNIAMTILDYKFDVCRNMQTAFKNFIMRTLMEELRRSSNLPSKCPLEANKLYTINNFTVTRDFFPSFTPETNFTVTVNFYYKDVEFARQVTKGVISLKIPKYDKIKS